ncbi:hypothetical protein FB451DRAFT_1566106 [Mycena latifolia]|nr:hypothetical protein FB451DRAFT_1566106 [Mycena latifolia]
MVANHARPSCTVVGEYGAATAASRRTRFALRITDRDVACGHVIINATWLYNFKARLAVRLQLWPAICSSQAIIAWTLRAGRCPVPRHSEVLRRRAAPLLVDSLLLKRDHPRARRSPPTPSGGDYDVYGALLSALSSPLLSVLPSPVPFTSSSSASRTSHPPHHISSRDLLASPSISSSPSTRLAVLLSPTLHSTPKWDETYDNAPFSPLVAPAPCSSSPPPSPIEALSLITYAAPEEPAGLAHFPPTPTAPAAHAREQKDVPPRPVPCSRWSTSTLASVYSAHVLRAPALPRPARPHSPSRGGTSPACPTPTPPRAPASRPRQRCWASTRRARPVADTRGRRVVGVGLGGASSSASPMPMPPTHFLAKSTSGFSGQCAAKLVIHKSIESGIGARQASVWSIVSEEAHEKEVHKEVHEEEIHEEVHEEEVHEDLRTSWTCVLMHSNALPVVLVCGRALQSHETLMRAAEGGTEES